MQVKELIEMLQDMNPEAEVHFAYNFGDYWRTEVAPKVGRVDEGVVEYSEYHRMDKMASEDYDDEDEDTVASQRRVVVLS
jgi:hypothetical protein